MQVTNANVGSVIITAIPEFRVDVEECAELDHVQFMEFFLWTKSSLRSGNADNLHRAIRLVDGIFQDCDAAIKNAVTVSFLECIDPDDEIGKPIFDVLTRHCGTNRRRWTDSLQLIGKSLRGSVARNADSRKS